MKSWAIRLDVMWGSRLLLAATVLFVVVIATGVYRAWNSEGPWRTVSTLESLQPESVTYMEDEKTFVVVEGDRVVALSAVDPHLGHLDRFCPDSKLFEGQHGEKFDRWGAYFSGPAPGGMDRVSVRVEDGVVEIDPTDVREGFGRGDVRVLEPEGRYCDNFAAARPGFFEEGLEP
jgi:nitrite reductase/ring-hydroxylating ferredoxin subunit